MNNDSIGNIITLTDEDGKNIDFEIIGHCEIDGSEYFAIVPVGSLNDSSASIIDYTIIKHITDEDGKEYLTTIEDDDELDRVADHFDAIFEEEIDADF